MDPNDIAILKAPISELPLSENFYLRCKLMGYGQLEDILRTPPDQLVRQEDFSYEWLGELSAFMNSRQLLHRLQPIPGNTSY